MGEAVDLTEGDLRADLTGNAWYVKDGGRGLRRLSEDEERQLRFGEWSLNEPPEV